MHNYPWCIVHDSVCSYREASQTDYGVAWPASSLGDRIFISFGILWDEHHNEACSAVQCSWVPQDSRLMFDFTRHLQSI